MSENPNTPARGRWSLAAVAFGLAFTFAMPAHAKQGGGADGLYGLLSLALLLAGLGLAVGAFSLAVSRIFKGRSTVTYQVLRRRPGISLLTGVLTTAVAFGLLAVSAPIPAVPGLVLLAFLLGLGQFAIAAAGRLGSAFIDPVTDEGEPPDARAQLKGGLLLVGLNAVPILGSILFFGILLAGIGATLLGYFSGMGSRLQRVAAPAEAAAAPVDGGGA